MAIAITKLENTDTIVNDDYILTTLYGQIKIGKDVDLDKYTYFDSVDGFDLFVDETGSDTVAIKSEGVTEDENSIDTDIQEISNKYDIETIKYDDTTPAIIIKVDEYKTNVIQQIAKDYKNNKKYDVKIITPQVLFLELSNIDIQLEDNTALDKLSDQDMKNVIQKAGIKLSGTENKERLKGIMQGVLSTTTNK